jgi:hypothetical protein
MQANCGHTDCHKYQKDKLFPGRADDREWSARKKAHSRKRRQNHRQELHRCMMDPDREFQPSQYVNDWIW